MPDYISSWDTETYYSHYADISCVWFTESNWVWNGNWCSIYVTESTEKKHIIKGNISDEGSAKSNWAKNVYYDPLASKKK